MVAAPFRYTEEPESEVMDDNSRTVEIQLESIFIPYAKKCRDEILARKGRFVHYTSAENAMRIIRSGKLWMRNANCMNDYMEIVHGYDLLRKFFQNPVHKQSFVEALNACGDEIAQKTIDLFDGWWKNIEFNTFISCISEHNPDEDNHGRLSMWRAYGELSAKAAIVVNIPFEPYDSVKGLSLSLSPVAYFSYEDVERELTEVINNIKNNIDFLRVQGSQVITDRIFAMLVMAVVSLKHEGFKEEKEWRIIYLPDLIASKLILRSIETIKGVPQTVYQIPLEDNPTEDVVGVSIPRLVDRIIIGPSEYSYPLYQAFKLALEEAGVQDSGSRVIVSGIPLRT